VKEDARWLALVAFTRKPREGASSLAGGTTKPKTDFELGFRFYFKCAHLIRQNQKTSRFYFIAKYATLIG
jgi:hypothetical protein